jgi:hypothetical protein
MNLNKYLLIGLMLIGCNDYSDYADVDAGGSTSVSEISASGGYANSINTTKPNWVTGNYGGATAVTSTVGGQSASVGGRSAAGGSSAALEKCDRKSNGVVCDPANDCKILIGSEVRGTITYLKYEYNVCVNGYLQIHYGETTR